MPRTKPKPATAPQATAVNGLPDEVLTLAETAAYLRISEPAVLQAIEDQDLPARRFGTDWRFFKPALQEWMKTQPPRKKGIWAHAGAFKDDPSLEEMVQEIYKRRRGPETEET